MALGKYDAVIIGGGHNALACAIHMAKRGRSICLLEQSDRVGGAIRTEEATLPGFRHDLYAMNLSLFAGSAFAREYGKELASHGLEYAPASDCFSTAFPDGRWLGVSQDAQINAERIRAFSARDADRWLEMTAAFAEDAPHWFSLLGAPMRTSSLAALGFRTARRKGRQWTADAARFLLSSPREFLDATFESPHVKALLAPWAMHLDFPPDSSGGALFPYLEAMADQTFGMALGKGGADTVPKAMAAYLEELGGTVRTGARVARVERVAGRATAAVLEDGERIAAEEAIVASVTPRGLLSLLDGSTGRASLDRQLAAFRHGPGTMMVHVAADALPDWSAGEELRRFAYVHLAPSLGALAAAYDAAMEGRIPAEPAVVVGQPTAVDPSRAPEGHHVLWLQVRVVPSKVRGDEKGEIAPGAWADVKEAVADRVMAILERHAPGFGGHVLARTVHAPDDLEAANPNLVGGDSIGGSHHLRQNFLFRPAFGMANYATPVPGLFMVGASTWPGAGCGAGSGFLLGRKLAGR